MLCLCVWHVVHAYMSVCLFDKLCVCAMNIMHAVYVYDGLNSYYACVLHLYVCDMLCLCV